MKGKGRGKDALDLAAMAAAGVDFELGLGAAWADRRFGGHAAKGRKGDCV